MYFYQNFSSVIFFVLSLVLGLLFMCMFMFFGADFQLFVHLYISGSGVIDIEFPLLIDFISLRFSFSIILI